MKTIKVKVIVSTIIFAAMLTAFATSCKKPDGADAQNGKGKPPEAAAGGNPGAPEAQVFAVNTAKVAKGPISAYLALAGDLVSGSSVDVYSEAAQGKVARLSTAVGRRVTTGQEIARIDPSKPGMKYAEYIVRAPITGTITMLPAEVGMTISSATVLARIAGSGALEILLHVPERYISKVRLGLSCEINLDAYPGESFRGSVREISPTVDTASRTEEIKVNVDNPGSRLKAGMFAKVKIITEKKDNIVKIPASAVVQRQGKDCVFVVVPDPTDPNFSVAHQIEVTLGILVDNVVEIQSGLNEGDEIVEKGMTLLSDGARVNVISRSAGAQ